tara:strand:- start:46 stop:882 length:837 start_codon:yes stop_codon:yes gene_type:complete
MKMNESLLVIFVLLTGSVPFLYRMVRQGSFSWFIKNDDLQYNESYKRAEKLRFFQIILGLCYFIVHGSIIWEWVNILIFMGLALIIGFAMEIIGSKTGLLFGGKYEYDIEKFPGPILEGVPLIIPISWAGLTYMGLNFCSLITGVQIGENDSQTILLIIMTSLFVTSLDLVLDPLAVNEKRWGWKHPGSYYKVPILNFAGWFFTVIVILCLYSLFNNEKLVSQDIDSFLKYSPALLFSILPLIASRPCFERGLIVPGIIGLMLSLAFILLLIIKLIYT